MKNKLNIYIDGTWLFKQCVKHGILAKKTYDANKNFRIDFKKLTNTIQTILEKTSNTQLEAEGLWYYTSIIEKIPSHDHQGNSLQWLQQTSEAKKRTAENAKLAGYNTDGVFYVEYQPWMPQRILTYTYQEKMVDTSLVARMVLSCINSPRDFHVLITGDLDMLPAVSLIVPEYLEKVVLFTTHPDQWDPNMQQTSRKLVDFSFKYGPFYLEDIAKDIMFGNNVYICSNPACSRLFAKKTPVPNRRQPFCPTCLSTRPKRQLI